MQINVSGPGVSPLTHFIITHEYKIAYHFITFFCILINFVEKKQYVLVQFPIRQTYSSITIVLI
jgi:hypothetical protein